MIRTRLVSLVFILLCAIPYLANAAPATEMDIDRSLHAWDLDRAVALATELDDSPTSLAKRGVIAVFEARYVDAEGLLSGALAMLPPESDAAREANEFLALARGAQQALGDEVRLLSPDGEVEAVFADAKDAILAPYLFEAMAEARQALNDILGVQPTRPIRFEFFDNPAKLALVTPLTVKNIRTTGTVGVTKYHRVMMITPRVMLYGYGWLDTAVHEYVHYLLSIRTRNRAPVWLQEGLAKRFETRWRRTTPEPLKPTIAHRLHQAIVNDNLVTLAEMYPSVAMLPSAERASLAYAEVETMLGLLHEHKGNEGLAVLLDAVAAGHDAEAALAEAWGSDFDSFIATWKRVTAERTADAADGELRGVVFTDEGQTPTEDDPLADVFSALGGGQARQHARLGSLLQARGHRDAAATQYEKAQASDARAKRDPTLTRRLGKLYVELGRYTAAAPQLDIAADADPDDPNLAAYQGRAHLRAGSVTPAGAALRRALRLNPFIPMVHCDLAQLLTDPIRQAEEQALCTDPHR